MLGISRDAAHLLFATVIFLGAAAALRRSVLSPLPWLILFAAEAANEISDFSRYGSYEAAPDYLKADLWTDLVMTFCVPALISLFVVLAPATMWAPPSRQVADIVDPDKSDAEPD